MTMWLHSAWLAVIFILFITLPLTFPMDCLGDDISSIKTEFKNCLERQKEPLLGLNSSVEGLKDLVCSGLDGLVNGCKSVITKLS